MWCLFTAVDGVWMDWSHWGHCDVSCGTGSSTRTRSCTNPPPAHGGNNCQGTSQETSVCLMTQCPGKVLLTLTILLCVLHSRVKL